MPVLIGDPGLVIVEYLDVIVCHRHMILVLLLGLLSLAATELIVDICLKDTDSTHVVSLKLLLESHSEPPVRVALTTVRLQGESSATELRGLMERVDGLEPTTGGLESRSSAAELHPRDSKYMLPRRWGIGSLHVQHSTR